MEFWNQFTIFKAGALEDNLGTKTMKYGTRGQPLCPLNMTQPIYNRTP